MNFNESAVYAIQIVNEYINEIENGHVRDVRSEHRDWEYESDEFHNEVWRRIEKDFPYLRQIRDAEGVYGIRRICMVIGPIVDDAFNMFDSHVAEDLIHGWPGKDRDEQGNHPEVIGWKGVGDFDYGLAPLCTEMWLNHQAICNRLGVWAEQDVTVEQMHEYMRSLFPEHYNWRKR